MKKDFYITTPIYYVNDKPHIGHAYTTILADVISRFQRLNNNNVMFLTGLDEHGQKVEQAANINNIDPQLHCDGMVPRFKDLWKKLDINYNDFIRTTEDRHTKIVKKILQSVFDKGDIYFDEYEGLYSISEERFITEKEAEDGNFRDIKKIKEKNYFFKMSSYQQKLIDHIKANPNFILPIHRKNEVLGFLKKPLNDLCISRPKSRLKWGIELPFDSEYVTYVWFDALINYISSVGLMSDEKRFNRYWPANFHLIGKDILTTHCVYWPTMFMSIGIELPNTIFAHGWWLNKDSKMSKSIGNVIDPIDLIDRYGVDSLRYYLMREMVLGHDANFSQNSFIKRYNSDLANDLGNLVSRITNLVNKFFKGNIHSGYDISDEARNLEIAGINTIELVNNQFSELKINDAIESTMSYVRNINKYIENRAPWKLVKTNLELSAGVLLSAAEALRISSLLLLPIMPKKMEKILYILGDDRLNKGWNGFKNGMKIKSHDSLFPRIEIDSDKNNSTVIKKKNAIKNLVSIDEFNRIELKVAQIISAEKIKDSNSLYKIDINLENEKRQIVSGIAKHYNIDELIGKKIITVSNLNSAKIFGVESNGMLLAAKKGKSLTLVTCKSNKAMNGKRVY